VSNGLSVLGGIGAGLAMLMIFADVALRLFGSQFPGTYVATTGYFMLMLTFLPLVKVQAEDKMISVDAMYLVLPHPVQRVVVIVAQILSLGTYLALAYGTLKDAISKTASRSYALSGTLAVPTWPGYYILPLCFGLTALVVARAILVHRGQLPKSNGTDIVEASLGDRP